MWASSKVETEMAAVLGDVDSDRLGTEDSRVGESALAGRRKETRDREVAYSGT